MIFIPPPPHATNTILSVQNTMKRRAKKTRSFVLIFNKFSVYFSQVCCLFAISKLANF